MMRSVLLPAMALSAGFGIAIIAASACWRAGGAGGGAPDAGTDADTDSDVDTDVDTDVDADADTDSDTDTDTDTGSGFRWHTFHGAAVTDRGYAVAADAEGRVYVVGQSLLSWTGPSGEPPLRAFEGATDMFVLALAADGTYRWHAFYGSSGSDDAGDVAVSGDGGVYVVGRSSEGWTGPGGEGPLHAFGPLGTGRVAIVKLDEEGAYAWHTFLGEPVDSWANSAAADSEGGIAVGGTSDAAWYGPEGEAPVDALGDGAGTFVLALDQDGAYGWHTFYGSCWASEDRGVAFGPTGELYVSGTTSGGWAGPQGEEPIHEINGWAGIFVLALAADGGYGWHTFFGSNDTDDGGAVAASAAGVYVTGTTDSSWYSSSGSLHDVPDDDGARIFVLALDGGGAFRWQTFYGGPGADVGRAVAVSPSGKVLVAGHSWSSWDGASGAPPLYEGAGGTDMALLALEESGAYAWHAFFGSTDWDIAFGVAAGGTGGVTFVGDSYDAWTGPSGEAPIHVYTGAIDAAVVRLAE